MMCCQRQACIHRSSSMPNRGREGVALGADSIELSLCKLSLNPVRKFESSI